VDPIALEKEVKEILQGEHSFEEWRKSVLDNAQNSLTTAVDVVQTFSSIWGSKFEMTPFWLDPIKHSEESLHF
jgi:hypothetical protein